jgi:membrane protein implicated in regulation of membrane protease activity
MNGWDWNAIYLTCFGVGLVLSMISFFAGGLHLHVGHGHIHLHGPRMKHGASPINGFTLMAFLCWFGGAGYLMHRANVFGASMVLLFSALSGLAGAAIIFWFLTAVLMKHERTLQPEDTEMVGVIGKLSALVPQKGTGEMLYTQGGARRSAPVRSDSGEAIERGAEVIVMRYVRGVAYVKRWDDFEHGLLAEKQEKQGFGNRD